MLDVLQSDTFQKWLSKLKDVAARAKIEMRIRRLSLGNAGDCKSVGKGIMELRIDYGPGYRVYYLQRGPLLVVLLCGGDKRTQNTDIKRAAAIAKDWRN